jgi:HSP90 family molecular chaperone
VRELISNASDALEKQRFAELSGNAKQSNQEFYIHITTNEKERTLSIFDSGIGMSRQECCDNLGTIAKSGSQEFSKSMQDGDSDSIIG